MIFDEQCVKRNYAKTNRANCSVFSQFSEPAHGKCGSCGRVLVNKFNKMGIHVPKWGHP